MTTKTRTKKNLMLAAALLALLCLASCGGRDVANVTIPDGACVGLIETSENARNSNILWLDGSLQETENSPLPYSGLGAVAGFQNACYDGSQVILACPETDKKKGKVIAIDRKTGDVTAYPHERVNFTSYSAGEGKVDLLSNLNWEFFIDEFDGETGETLTLELPENVQADSIVIAGEKRFVTAMDGSGHYALYEVDLAGGKVKKCSDLKEGSPFLAYDGSGTLYFVVEGNLIAYRTGDGTRTTVKLDRSAPFYNLWLDKEHGALWIGYTDIHSEEDSYVERMDLSSGKITCRGTVPGSIWQMEAAGDTLYVLGIESFSRYEVDGNKLGPAETFDTYATGFFLMPDAGH